MFAVHVKLKVPWHEHQGQAMWSILRPVVANQHRDQHDHHCHWEADGDPLAALSQTETDFLTQTV
jgi:hypothetical protein